MMLRVLWRYSIDKHIYVYLLQQIISTESGNIRNDKGKVMAKYKNVFFGVVY